MINNEKRTGNFTSSEIAALMTTGKCALGFGAPAITYINEKRIERLLGRSIDDEKNAKPLVWGKLLESRVFELLGLDYTFSSLETDVHKEVPYWSGSKDGTREGSDRAVIDIKCPMTLKSFCTLVMPLYFGFTGLDAMKAICWGFEHDGVEYPKHPDGLKYYYQLVSNACINDTDFAELIVYMPYLSEIPAVKLLADGKAQGYWIAMAMENELPYLPDGGLFKNINVIRFQIPQAEKDLLKANVLKAGKLLGVEPSVIVAEHDNEVGAVIVR